jgi:hypothetical protein
VADKRSKGWLCDADNTRAKALATQCAFGDFIADARMVAKETYVFLGFLTCNPQYKTSMILQHLHLISITDTKTVNESK